MGVDVYPFRRGISSLPYSVDPWSIGQYAGFSDPQQTNERFKQMIKAGQQSLAIALDLPTQLGLDPDHSLAQGEVGRVGVSLASLPDVERLFDGIPLDAVRQLSTTANSIGPIVGALFISLAERRRVSTGSFSVRLQNDVLKEYVARGTQILPPEAAAELSVDVIEHFVRKRPGWVPMSVSGYHIRDTGASRAQELGFTLANAREYLRRAEARGISVTDVAKSLTWFMSTSGQPIHEAAKFRAARELWATTLHDDFGVRDEGALRLRIVAYTLGSEMSPFELMNNSVRIALAAMGAVLGGVQVLFCSSIDEALGLPSEDNARLSIRTQQIILRESGLGEFVDVLGGSTAAEALTDQILADARAIDREVSQIGGAVQAIRSGWMRQSIDEEAWRGEEAKRTTGRIGDESKQQASDLKVFSLDPKAEERRRSEFATWKAHRNKDGVARALANLHKSVEAGENLVEPLAQAFSSEVTIGEATDLLIAKYGVADGLERNRVASLGRQ